MKGDKKMGAKYMGKKKMSHGKKKMQESLFGHKYQLNYTRPEVGSQEYKEQFFASIQEQFGNPAEKFDDGVDSTYGEDSLLSPHDRGEDYAPPAPGEVGYAPQGRVGGEATPQQQATSEWESKFTPLTAEDFIDEMGMGEQFEKWIGQKLVNEGRRVVLNKKKVGR